MPTWSFVLVLLEFVMKGVWETDWNLWYQVQIYSRWSPKCAAAHLCRNGIKTEEVASWVGRGVGQDQGEKQPACSWGLRWDQNTSKKSHPRCTLGTKTRQLNPLWTPVPLHPIKWYFSLLTIPKVIPTVQHLIASLQVHWWAKRRKECLLELGWASRNLWNVKDIGQTMCRKKHFAQNQLFFSHITLPFSHIKPCLPNLSKRTKNEHTLRHIYFIESYFPFIQFWLFTNDENGIVYHKMSPRKLQKQKKIEVYLFKQTIIICVKLNNFSVSLKLTLRWIKTLKMTKSKRTNTSIVKSN